MSYAGDHKGPHPLPHRPRPYGMYIEMTEKRR